MESKMFSDKYQLETWAGPSMATVRARQLSAFGGKCKCRKLKDPVLKEMGGRKWISCLRCLGTIENIS